MCFLKKNACNKHPVLLYTPYSRCQSLPSKPHFLFIVAVTCIIIYGCLFVYCRCSERLNSDAEEFYDADGVEDDEDETEGEREAECGEEVCGDGNMSVHEVKMERRRGKIIQELLDTEQTYQHHLDHIATVSGALCRD